MFAARWVSLMYLFGFKQNTETLHRLLAAYSEPQRHYHSLDHLQDCLQKLKLLEQTAKQPHIIELALWFHDAVYKPFSSNNEQASADWAKGFMQQNHARDDDIARVYSLIMATKHVFATEKSDPDTQLLLDIDLSILGEPSDVYDGYEQKIRKEYRLVPFFLYRKKRREILNAFLQREFIYSSGFFRKEHEPRAKQNLQRAISSL